MMRINCVGRKNIVSVELGVQKNECLRKDSEIFLIWSRKFLIEVLKMYLRIRKLWGF